MTNCDNDQRKGNSLTVWLAAAVLLSLLYVLSIGPAYWLFDHELISTETLKAIDKAYSPVYFVSDNCPPLHRTIDWYISCWLDGKPVATPPTL